MQAILTVYHDRHLRTAAIVMLLQGAIVCSFGPYLAELAVHRFGFGNFGYAVLLVISSVLAVASAVIAGIRADQTADRRGIALFSVGALVAGAGLLTLFPHPAVFALAMGVLFPLGGNTFGQVFAMARVAGMAHPEPMRDGIMAVIRALFAAPFVMVLPVWAIVFSAGAPVLSVFGVGFVLGAILWVVVARFWPKPGRDGWQDAASGLSFRDALAEMAQGAVAVRVVALGAVLAATTVYMAVISLIMVPEVGRGAADVALYVGLVAGLEVPFMLILPSISRGWNRPIMILCGAALYAVHIALLPVLAGSAWVWLLPLPAAIGGAITLTVPIAYLQDLLADRPGAGSSLMAVQRLAGDVMAAACFGLGTILGGYGTVAAFGVVVSLMGATCLVWADRHKRGLNGH